MDFKVGLTDEAIAALGISRRPSGGRGFAAAFRGAIVEGRIPHGVIAGGLASAS